MRSFSLSFIVSASLLLMLAISALIPSAIADCGESTPNPEDGEVTAWFKNIGCKIQKGASDLSDSAKPWADKIGSSAKELGSSVAQKFDELKQKITDDGGKKDGTETIVDAPLKNEPTEKVPLAPLHDQQAANAAAAAVAAIGNGGAAAAGAAGEPIAHVQSERAENIAAIPMATLNTSPKIVPNNSNNSNNSNNNIVPSVSTTSERTEPDSFDERFLFQTNDCGRGKILDHHGKCRDVI